MIVLFVANRAVELGLLFAYACHDELQADAHVCLAATKPIAWATGLHCVRPIVLILTLAVAGGQVGLHRVFPTVCVQCTISLRVAGAFMRVYMHDDACYSLC